MGKKKKKVKKSNKIDYGSVEFHCPKCNYHFKIAWETIWSIQECTHGYVGYHLQDTFISCDKCGSIVSEETNTETY